MRNFAAMMYRFGLIVAALLFGLSSCHKEIKESGSPSEGIPGDVVVVCHESDMEQVQALFETAFKSQTEPNLVLAEKAESGQKEPRFNFIFQRDKAWDTLDRRKSLMLVFENESDDCDHYSSYLDDCKAVKSIDAANCRIRVYQNVWAKPQTVVRVSLSGKEDARVLGAQAKAIEDLLYTYELAQGLPANLAANGYCDSVARLIQGSYGFRFQFPPQFRLEFSNREVVWLWQETTKFYRSIFINIFPDSVAIDSKEKAIANRNAFGKKYLQNNEGTSAQVSKSSLFPSTWETGISLGKLKVDVLRGWYQEEGQFRRGPFVRYFIHDAASKRYIALDGFVHAPDMERLQFYRGLEIIANSFTISQ